MMIDLGSSMSVVGVETQGRASSSQMVTAYTVQTSVDKITFDTVPGQFAGGNGEDYVLGTFPATQARYVKIVVVSWVGHVSMRAGVVLPGPSLPASLSPSLSFALSHDAIATISSSVLPDHPTTHACAASVLPGREGRIVP